MLRDWFEYGTLGQIMWTILHPREAIQKYESALDVIAELSDEIYDLHSEIYNLTKQVKAG